MYLTSFCDFLRKIRDNSFDALPLSLRLLKLSHLELYNTSSSFYKLIKSVVFSSLHSHLLELFSLTEVLNGDAGLNGLPLLRDAMADIKSAVF